MAVVGRKLYALGGMLDGGYCSFVEMYDAEEDNWIEVDPMSQARCNPGIAVAGGKIYVVGGLGENLLGPPGPLKTVEYYDVRTYLEYNADFTYIRSTFCYIHEFKMPLSCFSPRVIPGHRFQICILPDIHLQLLTSITNYLYLEVDHLHHC